MELDRMNDVLYNAIVLLEESYDINRILEELGITGEEYNEIMEEY